jgi:predicted amidophosphoribosyltransferase
VGIFLRSFVTSTLEPFLPISCARCGDIGASPCASCRDLLVPAPACAPIDGLDHIHGLVAYDETSRPFVADIKFRGRWASARAFAPALAMMLDELVGCGRPGPILTWAPTTAQRARRRGFDQAEVLARMVAGVGQRRVRAMLERRGTVHQTGRSRLERTTGVAFSSLVEVAGPVVVVDDVHTTGVTLGAAARALRGAGATSVIGLALAVTPVPRQR